MGASEGPPNSGDAARGAKANVGSGVPVALDEGVPVALDEGVPVALVDLSTGATPLNQ